MELQLWLLQFITLKIQLLTTTLMEINFIYILQFIGVMTSMILADVSWTYYFIKVEERKSLSAGIWSALIVVFGIFTTINYVEDRSLVVAAIIGAFVGTFLAVEIKKRNEAKKNQ